MRVEPGMYFNLGGIIGNLGTNVKITEVTVKVYGYYIFSYPHTARIPIFEIEGNYIVVLDLLGAFSLPIRNNVLGSFNGSLSSLEALRVTERILNEISI